MNSYQAEENQNTNALGEHHHEPAILLKRDKAVLRKRQKIIIAIILPLFVILFLIIPGVHNDALASFLPVVSAILVAVSIIWILHPNGMLAAPFKDLLTISNGKIYYDHYSSVPSLNGNPIPDLSYQQIRVNSITRFEEDKKSFIIYGEIEYDFEQNTIYGREVQKIPKHFVDIHLLRNFLEQQPNSKR